ncbi:glycoside hydrolase 100 family protein [Vacuolonema iberomarrocanum]|uniref:glycoside hydrolase 100 family protein n=1 Tax=Vacuolonema iberomarrocanum TaxID=3454632 RepID=UPI0019F2B169|nr:glycoside hydrolase 100 family protein [filamentous cyanobacterium LEGE 07170]
MKELDKSIEIGWDLLEQSVMTYDGKPIGTLAACGDSMEALNYDQCFMRDFAVSAIAFLLRGETEIVRNFLLATLRLQTHEKQLNCFKPGEGLMPASFKVVQHNGKDALEADFGERAIARVTPVDSAFWWLILLRAYTNVTQDWNFAHRSDVQTGIRLLLDLCLLARFDMFPTMLVPDGSFMIDRRMGVYGYPLDIQVLFFMALQSAQELLIPNDTNDVYIDAAKTRLSHLTFHLRQYYWLNFPQLNEIYRYQSEEFGDDSINQFNIYADSIPSWLEGWLREDGGYFVGNLGPARMDFRWLSQGNLLSTFSGLANDNQQQAILNQLEHRWEDLVGAMPIKACFPALEGRDWQLITGSDPKNKPWSYHNGGSWPFLVWAIAAAAIKGKRPELGHKAVEIAASRLQDDGWPEYYDGRTGRLMGRKARKRQTWTIAGLLAAYELLTHPEKLEMLSFPEPAILPCTIDGASTPLVL